MLPFNILSSLPGRAGPGPEASLHASAVDMPPVVNLGATQNRSMFSEHKGKLAVGAAAMLGIAIFYKWRESKLARDDPQEYAQLQRIKTAVGNSILNPSQEEGMEQRE